MYPATWREDVVKLVYLPQLNRFVRQGAGEYGTGAQIGKSFTLKVDQPVQKQ